MVGRCPIHLHHVHFRPVGPNDVKLIEAAQGEDAAKGTHAAAEGPERMYSDAPNMEMLWGRQVRWPKSAIAPRTLRSCFAWLVHTSCFDRRYQNTCRIAAYRCKRLHRDVVIVASEVTMHRTQIPFMYTVASIRADAGQWISSEAEQQLQAKQCEPKTYSVADLNELFRCRTIAFVGDSVLRNLAITLIRQVHRTPHWRHTERHVSTPAGAQIDFFWHDRVRLHCRPKTNACM